VTDGDGFVRLSSMHQENHEYEGNWEDPSPLVIRHRGARQGWAAVPVNLTPRHDL